MRNGMVLSTRPDDSGGDEVHLNALGISPTGPVRWNMSAEEMIELAVEAGEGIYSAHRALVTETGARTGRSPNDKFIVDEPTTTDLIHWGSVNVPTTEEVFDGLREKVVAHLSDAGRLFVQDLYAGAEPAERLPIRVVTESSWHSAFARNMFVRPSQEELVEHEPQFTVLHAPWLQADPEADGVNSEAFVIVHYARREVIIGGTRYAGEIKKSIFSVMNLLLPQRGILPMHCSANTTETVPAIFFGLSGTGKTTLSADPARELIGDDEHGWGSNGVFNFEGGCYAKLIDLSAEDEPEIFATTKRFGTVLENVILDEQGVADFTDTTLTQNTRGSYPIEFIPNRTATSTGGHPKHVVFLTCDAFGVLPPISRLTPEQAAYHFISGYTAKVAGTEMGVTEPKATFSACFGAPFMPMHPSVYGELLSEKIDEHNASCWMLNTGWIAGGFGKSDRIRIKWTRALLNAALDGSLNNSPMRIDERFGFEVPMECEGVPSEILDVKSTWNKPEDYDSAAEDLVSLFQENFEMFSDDADASVIAAGPISLVTEPDNS